MSYIAKVLSTRAANLIRYWPLNDLSGAQATELIASDPNTASGIAWERPGFGDCDSAAGFDGSNDYIDVFTAALASACA